MTSPTNPPTDEIEQLLDHANSIRLKLNDELPNGVGNTIDALIVAAIRLREQIAAKAKEAYEEGWRDRKRAEIGQLTPYTEEAWLRSKVRAALTNTPAVGGES